MGGILSAAGGSPSREENTNYASPLSVFSGWHTPLLGDTRSGVVEQWLRRAANAGVEREIAEATAAQGGLSERRPNGKGLERCASLEEATLR